MHTHTQTEGKRQTQREWPWELAAVVLQGDGARPQATHTCCGVPALGLADAPVSPCALPLCVF